MPESGEKGKFSTDIGQEFIDAALRSVEKRKPEEAPAPPPAADPREKELEDLKAQLELSLAKGRELMEKLKDEHERKLRAVADLENFRKRAAKEKEEVQKFGIERLLRDVLPVLDNLDRALEHARAKGDVVGLGEGVAMTRKLFEDVLGKHGVKAFTSVGKPFDPAFHEAMQQLVTAEVPPGQVMGEILRGFTLNDRLVRPALVVVSKAPEAPPAKAEAPAEGEAQGGSRTGT
ncbi:MAG: nucleotide exchange factor GrpE [Myxococcales bacterium]|nr:nucleotide exchange factor GrpE [Myxococcales bacterium]